MFHNLAKRYSTAPKPDRFCMVALLAGASLQLCAGMLSIFVSIALGLQQLFLEGLSHSFFAIILWKFAGNFPLR